jgi:TPR repeat protein
MQQAPLEEWSIDQVCEHFARLGLPDTARLRAELVTGAALAEMTEDDLKELGLPMGIRKLHSKWRKDGAGRDSTVRAATGNAVRVATPRPGGGAAPSGPPAAAAAPRAGAARAGAAVAAAGPARSNSWPVFANLVLEQFIVSSGQAEVYKGTYSQALKMPVAAKVLHLDEESMKAFVGEVNALHALRHPNILGIVAFFEEPQLCIVTSWMEQGSLSEVLERARRSGTLLCWWERGRKYALDIARGLAYLHGQKVVHRDMKSLNVLVGADDVAVLADFGLAKVVATASVQVATMQMGTPCWMAPEMLEHGTYTAASDVYAFGIIVWELCACRLPYEGFANVHQLGAAVVRGERPKVDVKWPKEAREMMASCWSGNASARPSAAQVVGMLEGNPAGRCGSAGAMPGSSELALAKKLRIERRIDEARRQLQAAADGGIVEAMYEVGVAYREAGWGLLRDLREAAKWFRLAADRGHGPAMARLAKLYFNGFGVTLDRKKAYEWGAKAMQSQDAFAVGCCFYWGLGVAEDEKVAMKYFVAAAEHGNPEAQLNLGVCYETGRGVMLDQQKAVKWYTRAAKQGYAEAQSCLGDCCENGRCGEKDERKAVQWYTRAAEQGDSGSCERLAMCYEKGIGVTRDTAKAAQWRAKARPWEK